MATWDGSLGEFLSDLDAGSKHDWVRAALGEPNQHGSRRAVGLPLAGKLCLDLLELGAYVLKPPHDRVIPSLAPFGLCLADKGSS